jgi:hypothetical protein
MTDQVDRTALPIRRPPFAGVANQALGGSQPDWGLIGHVKPPARAPNVLLVPIDNAGFRNPGTFGGSIDAPRYDRMAVRVKIPLANPQEHHLDQARKFVDGLASRLLVSAGEHR